MSRQVEASRYREGANSPKKVRAFDLARDLALGRGSTAAAALTQTLLRLGPGVGITMAAFDLPLQPTLSDLH